MKFKIQRSHATADVQGTQIFGSSDEFNDSSLAGLEPLQPERLQIRETASNWDQMLALDAANHLLRIQIEIEPQREMGETLQLANRPDIVASDVVEAEAQIQFAQRVHLAEFLLHVVRGELPAIPLVLKGEFGETWIDLVLQHVLDEIVEVDIVVQAAADAQLWQLWVFRQQIGHGLCAQIIIVFDGQLGQRWPWHFGAAVQQNRAGQLQLRQMRAYFGKFNFLLGLGAAQRLDFQRAQRAKQWFDASEHSRCDNHRIDAQMRQLRPVNVVADALEDAHDQRTILGGQQFACDWRRYRLTKVHAQVSDIWADSAQASFHAVLCGGREAEGDTTSLLQTNQVIEMVARVCRIGQCVHVKEAEYFQQTIVVQSRHLR